MYKLLLVTDRTDVKEVCASSPLWENLGFRQPQVVSSADEAAQSLSHHHVDAIVTALPEAELDRLMHCLYPAHPILPVLLLSPDMGAWEENLHALNRHLYRTHADFSNDDFHESDLLTMCRHEYFRHVITNKVTDPDEVRRQLYLLRSPMDLRRPCVLAHLHLPADEELRLHWRYGASRLETAFHNFFGSEVEGMRLMITVTEDDRIYLLAAPRLDVAHTPDDSQLADTVVAHAHSTIDLVREYMGMSLTLDHVQVLPSVTLVGQGV